MDLKELLHEARTIAVLGASNRPTRTSYAITRYLITEGYDVIPVNPNYRSVHGIPCLDALSSIPDGASIDIVNVFRHPRHMPEILDDVKELADRLGAVPTVWTQIGVSTPASASRAEELGLPYVANRCIMVEHSRYF